MYKINTNYQKLPGSYLFSNIAKKVNAFTEAHPEADIIRLGIGDVTQPIAPAMIEAMHKAVDEMGDAKTFHGYAPDSCGMPSWHMIIRQEDATSLRMRFLYPMEPRVIPVIFRRFFLWTTVSLSVILFTRFMLILTLWQEEQVYTMQIHRCGAT